MSSFGTFILYSGSGMLAEFLFCRKDWSAHCACERTAPDYVWENSTWLCVREQHMTVSVREQHRAVSVREQHTTVCERTAHEYVGENTRLSLWENSTWLYLWESNTWLCLWQNSTQLWQNSTWLRKRTADSCLWDNMCVTMSVRDSTTDKQHAGKWQVIRSKFCMQCKKVGYSSWILASHQPHSHLRMKMDRRKINPSPWNIT